MNLYLVKCKGMTRSIANGTVHGEGYVVAKNPDEAYKKLRKHLDDNDLGFAKERELKSVELLADEQDYPDCGYKLFL